MKLSLTGAKLQQPLKVAQQTTKPVAKHPPYHGIRIELERAISALVLLVRVEPDSSGLGGVWQAFH